MDGYRTWIDRSWDHPVGRLLVILLPILGAMAMLDVFGRDPDYVSTAASGFAVWVIVLWRRPPSRWRHWRSVHARRP